MNIPLGSRVRCAITGFKGVATSRCEYINGCVQYGVTPQSVDNKPAAVEYIDEDQLEIDGSLPALQLGSKPSGGPRADRPPY